jgi:hypothetical protein
MLVLLLAQASDRCGGVRLVMQMFSAMPVARTGALVSP